MQKKRKIKFPYWKLFVSLHRIKDKEMNIGVTYLQEAQEFIETMPFKARLKMLHNISMVQIGVKDTRIFKKLGDSDIWEFRSEYDGNVYRLLSFWDKTQKSLVVATHGFDKKTQKTPQNEIRHAEQIRNEYYKTR